MVLPTFTIKQVVKTKVKKVIHIIKDIILMNK